MAKNTARFKRTNTCQRNLILCLQRTKKAETSNYMRGKWNSEVRQHMMHKSKLTTWNPHLKTCMW